MNHNEPFFFNFSSLAPFLNSSKHLRPVVSVVSVENNEGGLLIISKLQCFQYCAISSSGKQFSYGSHFAVSSCLGRPVQNVGKQGLIGIREDKI